MLENLTNAIREARTQQKPQYQSILSEHGISGEVSNALLADGLLGGRTDIAYLQKRQAAKIDPREQTLLHALEDLENTPVANTANTPTNPPATNPKSWSADSKFAAPKFDNLSAVERGEQVLKPGDGGALVGEAWDLLDQAGFREAEFGRDQRYGDAMAGKVRDFQTAKKLPVTGEIDKGTLAELRGAGGEKTAEAPSARAARDVARDVSTPLKRSWNDWAVRDHEARSSIETLSRYDQKDLTKIAAEMDPKLVSRMLGNLSNSDRAQFQPTIERLVNAQNGRREPVLNQDIVARQMRVEVLYGDGRAAIDRLSRMNDSDFTSVADRLGSDSLSRMVDDLCSSDRQLYAPTIARLRTARNTPRANLAR